MKGLLYILGMIALVVSCTSVDCSEYGMVTCKYSVEDALGKYEKVPGYLSVSVTRSIDGNDTTLLNKQQNADVFELPMSYSLSTDTMHFTLVTDTASATRKEYHDEVYINKTNEPHFEDTDCAARFWHTILSASNTHNFIDSVIINNKSVTNDASTTNILIMLRTDIDL